jgi:hypothetical protein
MILNSLFALFLIFLFESISSINLKSKSKSVSRMTSTLSQNYTQPVYLPPPSSGATATPTFYTGTPEEGTTAPSQPGVPAAFIPMTLGSNLTTARNVTPVYEERRRNRTEGGLEEATLPEQPGVPAAFIPQPLIIATGINNTASPTIPPQFWLKINNTDYIVLKSRINGYLSCQEDGNMTTISQLPNNTAIPEILWIPELIRYNTVSLKSSRGGYLYMNNSLFYCNGKTNNLNSQFLTRVGVRSDRSRTLDYIAFGMDIGYLGIKDNIVMLIQQLDQRAMFDPIKNNNSNNRTAR